MPAEPQAQSRMKPIEILLVEDNPGDARLTREALAQSKVRNNLHHAQRRRGGDGVPPARGPVAATRRRRTSSCST